jgi:hypothetical protein
MSLAQDRKPPAPQPKKLKQRISRQRRKRLDRDAIYLALRDIYLEENPTCMIGICQSPATEVHHICSGTAGRAASLLNQDTWLGVCHDCHDWIESKPIWQQIEFKIEAVRETIRRLRT